MVTIQLNNKVFYLLLTILLIITISLTVFALTPLNGHDVSQIDFNSQIPSLSVSGTAELGILRLADTGKNNISWDIQEESNNDLTFKYMMEKVRITAMGDVGIGTIPSAKLHVAGTLKVDGNTDITGNLNVDGNIISKGHDITKTKVAYANDPTTRVITSGNPSVIDPNLVARLDVDKDDLILVQVSPINLLHTGGGVCYMRIIHTSGPAEIVNSPRESDWVTSGGIGWGSGSTLALFKATNSGNVEFKTQWHGGGPGKCQTVYRAMIAYVIGTA